MWFRALRAEGASERTIENHRYQVGRFVQMMEEMGCQTLEDVQADHIRQMLILYRGKKVSSHTLHNDYRNPRAFWNGCIREGLTEHNPFARVEPPKREQVLKRALTQEEIEKLYRACDGDNWLRQRDRALLSRLLDTGMRAHEVLQMRVSNALEKEMLVIVGKGGKQRFVRLSTEVKKDILRYLRAYPHRLDACQPES